MLTIVCGAVSLIFGLSLLIFHRPIARWYQTQYNVNYPDLPIPSLVIYIIPTFVLGSAEVILGILSLAGVVHWSW